MKKTENQNSIQFRKNFIWNLTGTTVNTLTSLLYMIIVTRINGLDQAGVFSFAFSNACVLVVVGMYMGRTYQINDIRFADQVFIQSRKITCLFMLMISLVMIMIYRYPLEQTIVFLAWILYKMMDAFSDVLYGVLHKNDRLDYVGQSLVLKGILSVVLFVLLDVLFKNILFASLGACAAMLAVTLLWDYRYYRKYRQKEGRWTAAACMTVLKEGAFVCATTLMSTYLVNASKYAIEAGGTDGEQAVYGILAMPATAMVLAGQYLIQPLLMKVSYLYRQREGKELVRTVFLMGAALTGVGVIGILCAATIGIPFLNIIYGVELMAYRTDLVIIMCGALAYGCATIMINILTIMERTKIQTACFACISAAVLLLSGAAVKAAGIRGAVLVYFFSMLAAFILLLFVTIRTIKKECF